MVLLDDLGGTRWGGGLGQPLHRLSQAVLRLDTGLGSTCFSASSPHLSAGRCLVALEIRWHQKYLYASWGAPKAIGLVGLYGCSRGLGGGTGEAGALAG